MARIPESEIEQLKQTADLQALVSSSGVELVRHGADWVGRCPFHADRTPSLVVSPSKGLWHCLGACSIGGTAIDWVMKAEGVSFRHAVELLRSGASLTASSLAAGVVVKQSTVPKLSAPVEVSADDAALLSQVVAFYHATLRARPEALAYLQSRGLDHPELVEHFRLGFANRTLGLRLPASNRKAGATMRERLQALGVLRESGHEHFNGSLVVPVLDAAGDVAELYGRKITPVGKLTPGTALHLYLPGPHRGVFNLAGIAGQEEVILCEALIDALTFWCAGLRNVTSSFGANGFTDDLLAAFKSNRTKRVLLAYDRDEAGDAAAVALSKVLSAHGIECYRILFPKGMDANAYALSVQPASKSLALVIRQAEYMGEGVASARTSKRDADIKPAEPVAEAAPPPRLEMPAYRVAPSVPASPAAEIDEKELRLTLGDRAYTVRGIEKNLSYEQLKVWVRAVRESFTHVDTLELYQSKQRAAWIKQAAMELGVSEETIKADLGSLMRAVEQRQDEVIRQKLSPKDARTAAPKFSADEQSAALQLLRDPRLMDRIVEDVSAVGVVGEDANALVGYLACVSRKLDKPLAVLIQSTSAAGKSTLMEALLSLMPEPERVHYSAMTGQSLFYLGEGDLRHKILAIAEEEGVRQAAYALKLLQSQGELTIASTGKDPTTGKLVTEEYRVEGPVMLFLTTTAIDLDEELLNRCLVLTINESREQTAAIHARQRQARTLAGLLSTKQGEALRTLHQAAQSLLRPLAVVNPYAEQLTFRSESTRMRRDHAKYLTLIDAIALLHQHQRAIKTACVGDAQIEYVEVTLDDIALANRLAHEVLGRSLDELPPQTRRVLGAIVALVAPRTREPALARAGVRFTRRELRAVAGITDTALRVHLERLIEMEYVAAHRAGQGQRTVYELLFDGDTTAAEAQLVGLRDVSVLETAGTTAHFTPPASDFTGLAANLTATSHPENTPFTPTSHRGEIAENTTKIDVPSTLVAAVEETAHLAEKVPRRCSRTGVSLELR